MIRTKYCKPMQRCAALFLSLVLLLGLLPAVTLPAAAAHKYQQELDTLVEWGIMRGDEKGNLNPDGNITRAEFVTMINRAFGYTQMGTTPFTDVYGYKWYSDDIAIAYNAGYFKGVGDGTIAAPEENLNREQAAVIIARNLALEERSGEALGFTDSRDFSNFSRGLVESLIAAGIIYGYDDGSFKPLQYITRAEVGCMLVRALGYPIQEAGDYSLGGVYTNVTITTAGVTLRDTVVAGDLYLSGGVSLGDVLLENVTVLGKIVVCGGGESQDGESSVVLRNVTADEMVVDNVSNQFLTISADGDTSITNTSVRTHAYIQDLTSTNAGLKYITLEGEDGTNLTLAGGVGKVTNLTPGSTLSIAQGFAKEVTVDEAATDSTLKVENGAYVKQLNLDVSTTVSGSGDIASATINASNSSSEILPDTITIRPGLTAEIAGERMDTVTAAESSADPRLLTGYPKVADIAPTTASGVFSANKSGTVYWAITAVADGSVSEKDLVTPPAYSGKILQSGSVKITGSNTEFTVKLSRLTSGGSYYLSAILVDSRGQRSTVKVTAFTTPDNSTPAFSSGYPYMSKITNNSAQVTVMTTKSCQLYYALLPKGASTPTAADFKANSISGNLGYGSMTVTKNIPSVFYVNGRALEELESYDLYLWLTDFDGGKSSAVKKVSFTTVDGTAPIFLTEPTVTSIKATSVALKAALNEKGTFYWVAVKHGEEYPKPLAGQTSKPTLDSDTAKLQVVNGMNCLKSGKVNASASKDFNINVSGLTSETAYDLYYVAVDSAGNYSSSVQMITINTLDTVPPTITQSFSSTSDTEGKEPMSDTDVIITFSEGIQYESGEILVELYNTSQNSTDAAERERARNTLTNILRNAFQLYDSSSYPDVLVEEDTTGGHWINYENVIIEMEDGKTVVTFEYDKAIKLKSGGTYYFQIRDLYDTSNNKNRINPNPQKLEAFTTVFAQAALVNHDVQNGPYDYGTEGTLTSDLARVDMSFEVHPISTENVDDTIYYDLFLWTDRYVSFNVYLRVTNDETKQTVTDDPLIADTAYPTPDANGWFYLGNAFLNGTSNPKGVSIHDLISSGDRVFTKLNQLRSDCTYEFVISLTQLNDLNDWREWSGKVTFGVTIPAGQNSSVRNLANSITEKTWKEYQSSGIANGGIRAIGNPSDFSTFHQFSDTKAPSLRDGYPKFTEGDTFVSMTFQANRAGTLYYVLAPVDENGNTSLPAIGLDNNPIDSALIPTGGRTYPDNLKLSEPTARQIYSPEMNDSKIKTGKADLLTGNSIVEVSDLLPRTTYYVYLVTKGDSENYSDVYVYQFTTADVDIPYINLSNSDKSGVNFKTDVTSKLDYVLIVYNNIPGVLQSPFDEHNNTNEAFSAVASTYAAGTEAANKDGDRTSFSVLDALLTTCQDSNGRTRTVFDVYASNDVNGIRAELAQYIRQMETSGSEAAILRGSISELKQNISSVVNFESHLEPNMQYYCVAVAHNVQGTADGFSAIKNIELADKTAPYYVSVNTYILHSSGNGGLYTGSVTITFSEAVYYLPSNLGDRTAVPVLFNTNNIGDDKTDGADKHVYFHNNVTIMGETNVKFSPTKTTTTATDTFTLDFENVTHGTILCMFADGVICDASGNPAVNGTHTLRLTLTFNSQAQVEGSYVLLPAFEATWG